MKLKPYPSGYVCIQFIRDHKIQHEIVPRHQARDRNRELTAEGFTVIFTSFC